MCCRPKSFESDAGIAEDLELIELEIKWRKWQLMRQAMPMIFAFSSKILARPNIHFFDLVLER
jgi:hypothetical protein